MSTTLADLRADCRSLLASTADWPDETLDGWIADAIRFYSADFPRLLQATIALTTGTQTYPLPGGHGCLGVLSVEYPAGEDPPRYLTPAPRWSREFASGGPVYALLGVPDDLAADEDEYQGQICFAEPVTTGESAVITYHGLHAIPAPGADDAQITVPAAHWEALIACVDFRAHWELETDQACSVGSVSIVLAQLGQEARRAWLRYREVIDHLQGLAGRPGGCVAWPEIGL